jgi:hypothetical protein
MFNITFFIVLILLTALSYYKGRSLLFTAIVSFYPTAIIYQSFPYQSKFLLLKDTFYSHALLFAVFFFLIFFVARSIVHGGGMNRMGIAGFIDALLISLSVVLLVVLLCFKILPAKDVFDLSKDIQGFLTSGLGYFLSAVIPLAVVYWSTRNQF